MDFSLSAQAQDYYSRVKRFMDEQVTPVAETCHNSRNLLCFDLAL